MYKCKKFVHFLDGVIQLCNITPGLMLTLIDIYTVLPLSYMTQITQQQGNIIVNVCLKD